MATSKKGSKAKKSTSSGAKKSVTKRASKK